MIAFTLGSSSLTSAGEMEDLMLELRATIMPTFSK
jgi:hypothetical protein